MGLIRIGLMIGDGRVGSWCGSLWMVRRFDLSVELVWEGGGEDSYLTGGRGERSSELVG